MLTGVLFTSQELTNLKIGPEIGLKYHRDILNAMEKGDSEMASLLMKRHIEATIQCIEEKSAAATGVSDKEAAAKS